MKRKPALKIKTRAKTRAAALRQGKGRKRTKKNAAVSDFIKSFSINLAIIALIAGMNWYGLSAIGQTLAYYNDTETSSGNAHIAGSLDFALVPASHDSHEASHEKFIGLAEKVSISSVLVNSGTLDWQYTLEAEKISGNDDFCNALELEAKLNGVEKYDGSLLALDVPVSSALGTWKFNIEFPVDAVGVAHGDTCKVDFVYKGWQKEIPLYEDSGFTDEERISVTLTARMIVLNEFLPNPEGEAYGFDFGKDSSDMPQGEWVEIYNNSDTDMDITGWYLRDATPGEGNKTPINTDHILAAFPVVPAHGWLVVYMNKPIYNNTGDTVRLFNDSDALIDSHTYEDNDFCEIEPSPGDENSTDASGECGGVPPNKSYARIPDGIGEWVDPIPTPGGVNRLGEVGEAIVAQNSNSSSESESVPAEEIEIIELLEPETATSTEEILEMATSTEAIIEEILPAEETLPDEPVSEPVTIPEESEETPLEPSSEGLTGQANI